MLNPKKKGKKKKKYQNSGTVSQRPFAFCDWPVLNCDSKDAQTRTAGDMHNQGQWFCMQTKRETEMFRFYLHFRDLQCLLEQCYSFLARTWVCSVVQQREKLSRLTLITVVGLIWGSAVTLTPFELLWSAGHPPVLPGGHRAVLPGLHPRRVSPPSVAADRPAARCCTLWNKLCCNLTWLLMPRCSLHDFSSLVGLRLISQWQLISQRPTVSVLKLRSHQRRPFERVEQIKL